MKKSHSMNILAAESESENHAPDRQNSKKVMEQDLDFRQFSILRSGTLNQQMSVSMHLQRIIRICHTRFVEAACRVEKRSAFPGLSLVSGRDLQHLRFLQLRRQQGFQTGSVEFLFCRGLLFDPAGSAASAHAHTDHAGHDQ